MFSVLKVNPNKSLSLNTQKFDAIASILEDTKKQFPILKEKFYVLREQM